MNKNDKISLENAKKIWKKPSVLTYGDAVEIIKAEKSYNLDDGNTFSGQSIGS
jgi:predicted HicB family RNase H-like nuclease